jgi:molybdate/tungstate transport system substrate-binding protein
MSRVSYFVATSVVFCAVIFMLGACDKPQSKPQGVNDNAAPAIAASGEKIKLTVFHSGALIRAMKEVEKLYEKAYPQVDVLLETAGSQACARKVTDQKRVADVLAVVDNNAIYKIMMPDYADWALNFFANEMALMYRADSKFADEISGANWHEILLREAVEYSHSDPNKDSCGYRAILSWKLAEKYYNLPGLAQRLSDNLPAKNIRPKTFELIAMLEAKEIDYLFVYKTVAEQYRDKFKFLTLPDEINLGRQELAALYETVAVELKGKTPGTTISQKGVPMIGALTIPLNADHPEQASQFIVFLIEGEGRGVFERIGYPLLLPPESREYEKLPPRLRKISQPAR